MIRKTVRTLILSASAFAVAALPAFAQDTEMTEKEKTGYAIGLVFGQQLSGADELVDLDALVQGLQDQIAGEEPKLSQAEIQSTMMAFQQQLQQVRVAEMEKAGAEAREAGEAFLAANSEKEGVVTLDSGLQYQVIEEGSGESPSATSTVETHYRGTLVDGTQFDSSYDRGQPATFPVNRVIPGWTEALQLMKPGSKWKLYVPYDLAYGPNGNPPAIPPYSTLIFDVELLRVVE